MEGNSRFCQDWLDAVSPTPGVADTGSGAENARALAGEALMEELPYPPAEELPADWRYMDWVERAMFVYQWRIERGHLPRPHWVSEMVGAAR